MSTPSIQTLITQAQQVLNLKSSNEIRATLAAILANANVGTPLNPNLTTQQLWDEFYEIVRQPSDDIMSIITDQMMRMVFSPPAPGGAGADKQVIFNDGGVLAGDPDLIFNKALNKLVANNIETAAGLLVGTSATITGDLTVDTSTLKVDSTNNRVGIGTASPSQPLHVRFDNAGPTTIALFENAIVDFSSSAAGQIVVGARGYNNTVLRQNPDIGTTPTIGGVLDTILANTYVAAGQGKVILATQSTARLTVHESSGDVSIANGNVVMATSGKGIDFSATANGSGTMTSELLNDYEEGTFTPTVGGSTGNGTAVYTTQKGLYTKIGRIVQIQIFVEWNTGTATGNQTVIGLPFTSNSTTGNYSVLNTYPINISLTALHIATSSIPPSASIVNIYQIPTGGGADASVPCDAAGGFLLTGTYTV